MRFNCLKATATSRRQYFTIQFPEIPGIYSFYWPQKDERLKMTTLGTTQSILPFSSQKFLVLILSTAEGWKAEDDHSWDHSVVVVLGRGFLVFYSHCNICLNRICYCTFWCHSWRLKCFELLFVLRVHILRSEYGRFTVTMVPKLKALKLVSTIFHYF